MADGLIWWGSHVDSRMDGEYSSEPTTLPPLGEEELHDGNRASWSNVWVDRYNARLLLESVADLTVTPDLGPNAGPSERGGRSHLSYSEDTPFLSAGETEDYRSRDTYPRGPRRGPALCVPARAAVARVLLDEGEDSARVGEDKRREAANAKVRGQAGWLDKLRHGNARRSRTSRRRPLLTSINTITLEEIERREEWGGAVVGGPSTVERASSNKVHVVNSKFAQGLSHNAPRKADAPLPTFSLVKPGREFDRNDTSLDALENREVLLDIDSLVKIDDHPADLAFKHNNVEAIADQTAFYLVGVVAPPLVHELVHSTQLPFMPFKAEAEKRRKEEDAKAQSNGGIDLLAVYRDGDRRATETPKSQLLEKPPMLSRF
ncbi:hypothetical protein V8D89_006311 [Ganoderma adspersum]